MRQGFDADTEADCTTCSTASRRVIQPVPVHYKGSGFYTTDYGRSKARESDSTDGADKKLDDSKGSKASSDKTSDTAATSPASPDQSGPAS